jgi:hypothetical protein
MTDAASSPSFKKATAKEKKSFARRFSFDRWMELCSNGQFADAFERGDLETCRNIVDGIA